VQHKIAGQHALTRDCEGGKVLAMIRQSSAGKSQNDQNADNAVIRQKKTTGGDSGSDA
jgi:hypothetical protein